MCVAGVGVLRRVLSCVRGCFVCLCVYLCHVFGVVHVIGQFTCVWDLFRVFGLASCVCRCLCGFVSLLRC